MTYEDTVKRLNYLIDRYETAKPVLRANGIYMCPACHKRTGINHSHCHWCGQKLLWKRTIKKGDD